MEMFRLAEIIIRVTLDETSPRTLYTAEAEPQSNTSKAGSEQPGILTGSSRNRCRSMKDKQGKKRDEVRKRHMMRSWQTAGREKKAHIEEETICLMRKLCSRWLIIIMRSNGALLSPAHSQYSLLQGQLASTRLVELHKTEVDTKTWGKVSIYTERKCVSMQPNSH